MRPVVAHPGGGVRGDVVVVGGDLGGAVGADLLLLRQLGRHGQEVCAALLEECHSRRASFDDLEMATLLQVGGEGGRGGGAVEWFVCV